MQQIENNNIALEGMRLGLSERSTSHLLQSIAGGMSYDQIRALNPNITRSDYESMRAVYEAELEGINLNNTGRQLGFEGQEISNMTQAINSGMSYRQFSNMFPGTTPEEYRAMKTMYDLQVRGVELGLNAQQTGELSAAIQAGQSYDQISAKYPNISRSDYDSMRQMYNAQLQGVNLNNTAIQLGLDAQTTQNMSNDIMAGMTYDQMRNKYPNFQLHQYNSMKKMYDLQVQGIELGLDAQSTSNLVDKINAGMTYDQIRRVYPEITDRQYRAMKTQYDMQMQAEQIGLDAMRSEALITAINQGQTFDQIKDQFPNVDENAYNSMKTLYDLQVEGANLDLQFKQLGLNAQESSMLQDAIAMGQTFEQIQQNFPETNLTRVMYDSMREASQVGSDDYEKKMGAVSLLISSGGAANLEQAEEIFGSLFPGMDIDFGNLVSQQNANNFNEGMANLSNYLTMSWETALTAMEQDGTMEKLGMTEGDVQTMFEEMQLNTNPIMAQEKIYKQLWDNGEITEAQYNDLMDFQVWSVSNQQGVTITDSYQVFDANGKEVQNFRTQAEADAYVVGRPNEGLSFKKIENGWITENNGSGTGGIIDQNEMSGARLVFDDLGIIADTPRIQEYLDANGGKLPDNFDVTTYNEWDRTTPSNSRISAFANGDYTVNLTSTDRTHLDKLAEAQKRLDAGDGSADDLALVNSIGITFSNFDYGGGTDFQGPSHDWRPGGGMGKLHRTMEADNNIYEPGSGGDSVKFTNEIKTWINTNRGKTVKIDGQWYVVEGLKEDHEIDPQTVISGSDSYTHHFTADAVILRSLEGGGDSAGRVYETFGARGKLWD